MRIERIPVGKIQVATYNPRKDLQPSDPEYVALERSLGRWDIVEPLVWNIRTGNLVGGHQRFKILLRRGDAEVDVSVVDLDQDEEAALNIALNKIDGGWDTTKLFDLLSSLDSSGLDVSLTGFEPGVLADLAKELDRPIFQPSLEPELEEQTVSQSDVAEAASAQVGRFAGARPVVDVTCPHCGKDFGLSAK